MELFTGAARPGPARGHEAALAPIIPRITPPEPLGARELSAAASLRGAGFTPLQSEFLVRRRIADPMRYARASLSDLTAFDLPGVERALDLLDEVRRRGDMVFVACDYDVDGVSAGAIAFELCIALGVRAAVDVPCRAEEGYGLNRRLIDDARRAGAKLLWALDFGTSQHRMIRYAHEQGMQTVVVDHHRHGDMPLPPASALVNPVGTGTPFEPLCAAGLAWLVARRAAKRFELALDLDRLSALAGAATVADVVPLTGVNRILVRHGLRNAARHEGLAVLCEEAGLPLTVTASDVAFHIGPIVNAPGRMRPYGARESLTILLGGEAAARESALEAIHANADRKRRERIDFERALEQLAREGVRRGVGVSSDLFDGGVAGLVASRLAERFGRPSFAVAFAGGGLGRASVRGGERFHVFEALERLKHLLERHGGHRAAGGFTIERSLVEEFADEFAAEAERQLGAFEPPRRTADLALTLSEYVARKDALFRELGAFAPFGNGNEPPLLLLGPVRVARRLPIGKEHFKLELTDGAAACEAYLWRGLDHPLANAAAAPCRIGCRLTSYLRPAGARHTREAALEIAGIGTDAA